MATRPPLTYGQIRDQLLRANLIQHDLLSTIAKVSLFGGGTFAITLVNGQIVLTKYTTRVLTGLATRYSRENFSVLPTLNPQGTMLTFTLANGKRHTYRVSQPSLPLLQALLQHFNTMGGIGNTTPQF
ncbi:MAG: hypothetical protein FWC82_04330 [Firmicutes bacterium]|nr:hypothetical protein [Bacillota bacterium]